MEELQKSKGALDDIRVLSTAEPPRLDSIYIFQRPDQAASQLGLIETGSHRQFDHQLALRVLDDGQEETLHR